MTRAVFYGDSITVGTYTAPGESAPLSVADPNYFRLVCEHFGWEGTSLA